VSALEIGGVPFTIVNGNHDDNSGYSREALNKAYAGIVPFSERFPIEFAKGRQWWIGNDADKTNPYGYCEVQSDLYIITLNAFDFPYGENDDGTTKYIPHGRSAWRIGQLKWLDTLLRSLPGTAQVLFISHANLRGIGDNPFSQHARNGNLITDMIVAFNKSGYFNEDGLGWNMTTHKSETEKNGDFKTSLGVNYDLNPTGRVIGIICGHTHRDKQFYYKGINIIETLCSACDRGEIADRTGSHEDAWDVVTVTPSARTVSMIRYGAGNQRERSFTY